MGIYIYIYMYIYLCTENLDCMELYHAWRIALKTTGERGVTLGMVYVFEILRDPLR